MKDSEDGVPKKYLFHECEGKESFSSGDYKGAIRHFRAALKVQKFESPNYDLELDLGLSLCKLGKVKDGKKALNRFLSLSLNDLKGSGDGVGSELSEAEKADLTKRRSQAEEALKACKKN